MRVLLRSATITLFLFAIFAMSSVFAQTTSVSPGAAATQSVYNAYWSNAPGVQSLAQLHNNLLNVPLTVQPVLFMTEGSKLNLMAVTLAPLGNATIDIGAELAQQGLTKPLSGSVAFQYQRKYPGALSAEVYIGNMHDSLAYTIPSVDKAPKSATQDAVFWIPSANAEVYVAFQNTSDSPINVSSNLTVSGEAVPLRQVQLAPHGSSVLQISSGSGTVSRKAWQKGSVGGVTVVHDGPQGALNTGGWIEDDGSGFSTTMTFADPSVGGTTLLGTQILVGAAGQFLKLPSPMLVSSQLVVRNTSSLPVNFHGELVFSDNDGTLVPVSIQQPTLAAGEVRGIDLGQLKAEAGVPASLVSASITLQWAGANAGLVARVFGASADESYGFYWALQPYAGASYAESFWTTEGAWIPILTIANFGTVSDNVTVEITSNSGVYILPALALHPSQSYSINVRDLIASGARDSTGKPFPTNASFGGYRVYGASQKSRLVVKEHLINPEAKLATPFYGNYVYALDTRFITSNLVYIGGSNQPSGTVVDNSDNSTSDGCPSSFTFSPGGIVGLAGVSGCSGYIYGISVGTTTITAEQQNMFIDSYGDYGTLYADAEAQAAPQCPMSITLAGLTQMPLQAGRDSTTNFPGQLTGIGAVATMLANPVTTNYNGATVTEAVSWSPPLQDTCSGIGIPSPCSGNMQFPVGPPGFSGTYGGWPWPATGDNQFQDAHSSRSSIDILGAVGASACTVVCYQTYSCGGNQIGVFQPTFQYNHSSINGTGVTQVVIQK